MLNKIVYNLLAVATTVWLVVMTFAPIVWAIDNGVRGGTLDFVVFISASVFVLLMIWLFGDWDEE